MSHSFTNLLYHLVWSTKMREPCLTAEVRPQLFAYLGGLVRDEGGIALIVNGVEDHVHVLAKLRQDKALSAVVRAIKANSSGWIHRKFAALACFAWQTGYGAFSVSYSQVEVVREYIAKQEEHHCGRTYQDEFRAFLRRNGIDFTEEDLWD